ncbi:hypothetical protein MX850_10855 [Erysipelothrix sp. Poltava]|nr:hypothetical protein MX850_10855 [Erysipelothrix sp. Poltava]
MNNKIKQNTANMLLKITLLVVLVIIFLLSEFAKPHNNSNMEHVTLHKCIDGDTAQLNIGGKKEKVRFIAVDTPEPASERSIQSSIFCRGSKAHLLVNI